VWSAIMPDGGNSGECCRCALIGRKTPVRAPHANAFCERLIGRVRRECLDWLILLHERYLRFVMTEWVAHDNHGRPYSSLGPGIPDPKREKTRELESAA
jgi:putative transposase